MNKKIIYSIIAIVIFGLVLFLINSKNEIEPAPFNDKNSLKNSKNTNNLGVGQNTISKSQVNINEEQISKAPYEDIDLGTIRERNPHGVVYTTLQNSKIDSKQKDYLKKQFQNLDQLGSFSGGVITHEFSNLDKKREGLKDNKELDFTPSDLQNALPDSNLKLTGKWYSGAINDGKYTSLYQLYEDPNNQSKKFEITEMFLDPKNNYVMDIYKESLNYNVNNIPMTIETLKNQQGQEVYNVHFVKEDRYYSLSTQDYSRQQIDAIVNQLTK